MKLPKKYTDLIGTKVKIQGPIFSYKKDIDKMKKVKLPKWLYTIFSVKVRSFTYTKTPYLKDIIADIEINEGRDSPKIIAIHKGSAVGCSISTATQLKGWAESKDTNTP